ncbi:hypothetical protein N7456_010374 [Penicillium angulare]|uniref:Aminotransferase class V domain-containing protein n=1 Tax=Penicillium angulare TaxID=116970 RepID=A0A9W9K637_9EURO|nr:hypothetical protein N7456_010374 [Penicillium angulare]
MAPMNITEVPTKEALISPKHETMHQLDPKSKFDIFRRLVPLVYEQNVIHLNAAFMPPSNLIVRDAIDQFCDRGLHHPSPKVQWKKDVEETRELVAAYLKTTTSSIAFTRDTTEAMGYFMHSLEFQPGDNVVILDCEHPNQAYGWLSLRRRGLEVRQVPTSQTKGSEAATAATAATFAPYVDDRTRAIGLSSIMFHNGQWNDIADVAATFKPRGIHILADLTQQVGFTDLDIHKLGVTAAAFSLHKGFNCPTGIAVFYVSEEFLSENDPVPPIVSYASIGTPSEDFQVSAEPISFHPTARRYEHANMSLIGAVAAKSFLRFHLDIMDASDIQEHLYRLGDTLRRGCHRLGIEILGPVDHLEHAPHLYTLKLFGSQWAEHFQANNVIVSTFRWGVRVSFGFYNNTEDVMKFLDVLERGFELGISQAKQSSGASQWISDDSRNITVGAF